MSVTIITETHPVKITVTGTAPDEHIASVAAQFKKVAFLFPSWLRDLDVAVLDQAGSELAVASPSYEGRNGAITVYGTFFAITEERQLAVLVHEAMHFVLAPLTKYAEHLEPERRSPFLVEAVEATTQDMTCVVTRLLEFVEAAAQSPGLDEMAALGVGKKA